MTIQMRIGFVFVLFCLWVIQLLLLLLTLDFTYLVVGWFDLIFCWWWWLMVEFASSNRLIALHFFLWLILEETKRKIIRIENFSLFLSLLLSIHSESINAQPSVNPESPFNSNWLDRYKSLGINSTKSDRRRRCLIWMSSCETIRFIGKGPARRTLSGLIVLTGITGTNFKMFQFQLNEIYRPNGTAKVPPEDTTQVALWESNFSL